MFRHPNVSMCSSRTQWRGAAEIRLYTGLLCVDTQPVELNITKPLLPGLAAMLLASPGTFFAS
ncbi:MAG: hypothetical protein NTW21_25315 [Verrucomicrobia bacterium]|nr:hypothetical protein [Verrucomicrobiota bacterium]